MDGEITIGTRLSTDKFDRQIADLEKKMKKEEDKGIVIGAKLSNQEQELEQARQKTDELAEAYQRLKQAQEKLSTGKATPMDFSTAQNLQNIYGSLEQIGTNFDKTLTKQDQLEAKVENTRLQYNAINDKVSDYKQKIESIKLQRQAEEAQRIKDNFDSVGSSIHNAISKIARLTLGVFGLRSAYAAVRTASSTLATYDQQYATNLEYIRYALAMAIAPVLEYIVNLAKTLLTYINYIANAWFGVNLFAKASANNFKKAKSGISGANTEAKKLQKTLLGFDEANILNSNSTGGGGGIGGVGDSGLLPDFDLSDWSNIKIPDWIKWIANNKEKILNAIRDIATAFLIFKTLQITGILSGILKIIEALVSKIGVFRTVLLGLGIALIIKGIADAIKGVIEFIKHPSWENFRKIIDGLSTAIMGLGVAMIALNATNPMGWIALGIGAAVKLTGVIANLIKKENEEKSTQQRLTESVNKLKEAREKLNEVTNNYTNAVDKAEETERALREAEAQAGMTIEELLKKMRLQNLTYKDLDSNQRQLYKSYLDNNAAQQQLTATTQEMDKATANVNNKFYLTMMQLRATAGSAEEYKRKIIEMYNSGKISATEATEAISLAMYNMDKTARDKFVRDIPDSIKSGLNPDTYASAARRFTNWWNNSFMSGLTKKLNMNINVSALGRAFGIKGMPFGTGGLVTKLASGAVINMPNRGVPVSSAIAGESRKRAE